MAAAVCTISAPNVASSSSHQPNQARLRLARRPLLHARATSPPGRSPGTRGDCVAANAGAKMAGPKTSVPPTAAVPRCRSQRTSTFSASTRPASASCPPSRAGSVNAGRRGRRGVPWSTDGERHAAGGHVTVHLGEDAPDDRVRAVGEIGWEIEQQRQRLTRRHLGWRIGHSRWPRGRRTGATSLKRGSGSLAKPQLHPAGCLVQHRANRRSERNRLAWASTTEISGSSRSSGTSRVALAAMPTPTSAAKLRRRYPPGAGGYGVSSGGHTGRLARPRARVDFPPLEGVQTEGAGGEVRIRRTSTG